MIEAIISGGQTGADQAGLKAGVALDIPTGGLAPKGWRTEAGPAPWLADYGLMEHDSENYQERTKLNVQASDGTVIFGRRSPGSNRTEEECRLAGKRYCWVWYRSKSLPSVSAGEIPLVSLSEHGFRFWIKRNNIKILNVAGNRESNNPGIAEFVQNFLIKALQ